LDTKLQYTKNLYAAYCMCNMSLSFVVWSRHVAVSCYLTLFIDDFWCCAMILYGRVHCVYSHFVDTTLLIIVFIFLLSVVVVLGMTMMV
jgi:hypothetical protein